MSSPRFRGKSSRKIVGFSRFLYPALGVVLAAPTVSVWMGLVRLTRALPFSPSVIYSVIAGVVAYLVVHFVFRKPMTAYVFGHELTHAAVALLSGYKVKSLFVSEKGGEVELSESNVFVALAPYCIPLYTVLVLLAYGLVRRYAVLSAPPLWVGFGVGLTLSFHVALTIYSLWQDQPDLRHAGTFFSMIIIFLANGLALVVVLKALFVSHVHLTDFLSRGIADTRILWERAWEGARWVQRGGETVWGKR